MLARINIKNIKFIILFFIFILIGTIFLNFCFPLKLTKLNETSKVVLDTNNNIIRIFNNIEDKIRLPIKLKEIDSN